MKTLETAHERMVAVPADPRGSFKARLYGVLFVVVCSVLGYLVTAVITGSHQKKLAEKNTALEARLNTLELQYEASQRELATAKTGAAIDRDSAEQVRAALRDTQKHVAELKEDLQFYKNLMDPELGQSGLDAYKLQVFKTATPDLFRYRLTVQQLGSRQKNIDVTVAATLSGISGGEPVKHNMATIVHDTTPWSTKIKFRYFANIDGMFRLPKNFIPEEIEVELTQKSKSTKTFNFNWHVLENNLYDR